jgi:hypothetical protein
MISSQSETKILMKINALKIVISQDMERNFTYKIKCSFLLSQLQLHQTLEKSNEFVKV